jgi:hypothetical protein
MLLEHRVHFKPSQRNQIKPLTQTKKEEAEIPTRNPTLGSPTVNPSSPFLFPNPTTITPSVPRDASPLPTKPESTRGRPTNPPRPSLLLRRRRRRRGGGRLAWPRLAGPMDWASAAYTAAALACAAAATVVALGHIYRHLLHYAEPVYQRFIVRIIFMVPVMLSTRSHVLSSRASDLSLGSRVHRPRFEGSSWLQAGIRGSGRHCVAFLSIRLCKFHDCLCYCTYSVRASRY